MDLHGSDRSVLKDGGGAASSNVSGLAWLESLMTNVNVYYKYGNERFYELFFKGHY